jgi:hypothetical protein
VPDTTTIELMLKRHIESGSQFLDLQTEPAKAWLDAIVSLRGQRDSEREAREKLDSALRQKDIAMSVLFKRLDMARVDYSDLIP